VAIFGVQFHTPEGQQRYGASGITEEMGPALEAAKAAGFLHQERLMSENSGVLLNIGGRMKTSIAGRARCRT
jgi:hypothetical protein